MLKSFSKLTIRILIAGDSLREEILKQAHEKKKDRSKEGGKIEGSLFELVARNFSSSLVFKTKVIRGEVDSNKRFASDCFREK